MEPSQELSSMKPTSGNDEKRVMHPNHHGHMSSPRGIPFDHPNVIRDSFCTRCNRRCGPIGWWFSPITDKCGYSLLTTLYHLFNFILAVFTMAFINAWFWTSVGLCVLILGIPFLWFTCEMAGLLARADLALAYFMVENDQNLITYRYRKRYLTLSVDHTIAPCPCSLSSSEPFGRALCNRMKSMLCTCETYKMLFYEMFFKLIITCCTWWMFIVSIYLMALVLVPIAWIYDSEIFTKGYVCPYGAGYDCTNDDGCVCYGWQINSFGEACLVCIVTLFVALPIGFRITQWFAQLNKYAAYFWLTKSYDDSNSSMRHPTEQSNLIANQGNNNNAPQLLSTDPELVIDTSRSKQNEIVHSSNNPYQE